MREMLWVQASGRAMRMPAAASAPRWRWKASRRSGVACAMGPTNAAKAAWRDRATSSGRQADEVSIAPRDGSQGQPRFPAIPGQRCGLQRAERDEAEGPIVGETLLRATGQGRADAAAAGAGQGEQAARTGGVRQDRQAIGVMVQQAQRHAVSIHQQPGSPRPVQGRQAGHALSPLHPRRRRRRPGALLVAIEPEAVPGRLGLPAQGAHGAISSPATREGVAADSRLAR